MPLLRQAQKNGAYVVVIDPRRTITARSADEHIQPTPATDGALALGMMHVLFSEGLADEAWLEANTIGWRELRERAAEYPPERVSAITGVPAETIIALARRYGTTKPALLKFADGVQRHGNGGQTVRALCLPSGDRRAAWRARRRPHFTARAAMCAGTARRLGMRPSARPRRAASI